MEEKISVTIGMPAYNGAAFLRQAIDSALAQTYTDFELIISDDTSTDGTEAICREYAAKDKRIRYMRQEKNLGGFGNISYILDHARGDYFTQLAQDDALKNNFLEEAVKFLATHPECILVSGDFEIIDEAGSTIRTDELTKVRCDIPWQERRKEFFRYPLAKTFFCIYGLARTEVYKDTYINMQPPKKIFKGSEMPFLSRLATKGEIASLPLLLRDYRQHSQSAYNVEFNKRKTENIFKRKSIALKNLYRIRLEQLRALFNSDLPYQDKFNILFSVYSDYFISYFRRLGRLPKKIRGRTLVSLPRNKKHQRSAGMQ